MNEKQVIDLINKCNRMALIIGQLHAVIAQQYNENPSENLKKCMVNLQGFIQTEFYGES